MPSGRALSLNKSDNFTQLLGRCVHKSWISGGEFSSQARLHADFKAFSCSLLDQDIPKSSIDECRASQLLFELLNTRGMAKTVMVMLCLNGSNRGSHRKDTALRLWAVVRMLVGCLLEHACRCHHAHVSLRDCPAQKHLQIRTLPSGLQQTKYFSFEVMSWEKGEIVSCETFISASCDLFHMK